MTAESSETTDPQAAQTPAEQLPRTEKAPEGPSAPPQAPPRPRGPREDWGRAGGPGYRDQDSRGGAGRQPRRRFVRRFHRRKVCRFCVAKVEYIDYKDARRLRRFMSERGKILPRRVTGCCAKHQRMLTSAIKRARNIALLPYKAE